MIGRQSPTKLPTMSNSVKLEVEGMSTSSTFVATLDKGRRIGPETLHGLRKDLSMVRRWSEALRGSNCSK